jgi:ubiquinol-cytochrome c reductase cytochrome c subunit
MQIVARAFRRAHVRETKMRFRAFVVSCPFVFLMPVLAAQTPTAPAGNAQNGKELYAKYSCYACHGYDGHGGAGARLVPMPMTVERFTAYVHNPRQMPPYTEKILSDAQLADLFAYIKSLPVSPAAKDIPLLARIIGERP